MTASEIETMARNALMRMAEQRSRPPEPIMSQEEYEALPLLKRSILGCNTIGCKKVVSTHGLLCVEHAIAMGDHSIPIATE